MSTRRPEPPSGAPRAGRALDADPIDAAREHWSAHGWGDAVDGMSAITSIMRVQQIALARVEQVLKPFGLTFARYEVLMLLHFSRRGALPVGKVGERLQVHPASVTNAVGRLESDGLVERSPHPDDGRSVLVSITEAGRTRAIAATESLNQLVFAAWPLDHAASDDLYSHLKRIRHAAGDFA